MKPARQRSSEAGFSLVETVAAMGILAMAAIPLLQISTEATANTASLESRLLARTVAENVINRTMASPLVLEAGLESGRETQMGRAFEYTLIVAAPDESGLQGMEVTVKSDREGGQTMARLVSLKAVPVALPGAQDATQDQEGQTP